MTNQTVVFTDADNTLWDTDSVFANAQACILSVVEDKIGARREVLDRVGFVRRYDQALATVHHLHLRYPPILLAFALAAGLRGVAPEEAAKSALAGDNRAHPLSIEAAQIAVRAYEFALVAPPRLLPGVLEGLNHAKAIGLRINVLTEGRIDKQRKLIAHHGLGEALGDVLEITKNARQFERLRQRFSPATIVVIGDQPDRDIEPAVEAGCVAVFVPSHFKPAWNISERGKSASFVASDFASAINWTQENAL